MAARKNLAKNKDPYSQEKYEFEIIFGSATWKPPDKPAAGKKTLTKKPSEIK